MAVCHLHKMAVIRTPLSDNEDVISHDTTTTELLKRGNMILECVSPDVVLYIPGHFETSE